MSYSVSRKPSVESSRKERRQSSICSCVSHCVSRSVCRRCQKELSSSAAGPMFWLASNRPAEASGYPRLITVLETCGHRKLNAQACERRRVRMPPTPPPPRQSTSHAVSADCILPPPPLNYLLLFLLRASSVFKSFTLTLRMLSCAWS